MSFDLSVVLPAYEEAGSLSILLPALHRSLQGLGVSYEILIVDTAQPRDDTPEICARENARYVPRTGGSHYGHAIKTGQANATGRSIILMDADGSHNPNFIPRLWEWREKADLVIASRYVKGGQTDNPAILIFLSLVVNVVFRLVLSLRCADVSNSFRLYNGDHFRALQLECDDFDIVEEILVRLCCANPGYRVQEVPFVFEQRKAGKTKRQLLLFAVGYLKTLRRLYRFKKQAAAARSSL